MRGRWQLLLSAAPCLSRSRSSSFNRGGLPRDVDKVPRSLREGCRGVQDLHHSGDTCECRHHLRRQHWSEDAQGCPSDKGQDQAGEASGCIGRRPHRVRREAWPPDLRKQTFGAVIVRQKYPVRRVSGLRISFEDNAAVIVTPEGELKGTDIKGPVASEAAERWPRIANLASIII